MHELYCQELQEMMVFHLLLSIINFMQRGLLQCLGRLIVTFMISKISDLKYSRCKTLLDRLDKLEAQFYYEESQKQQSSVFLNRSHSQHYHLPRDKLDDDCQIVERDKSTPNFSRLQSKPEDSKGFSKSNLK